MGAPNNMFTCEVLAQNGAMNCTVLMHRTTCPEQCPPVACTKASVPVCSDVFPASVCDVVRTNKLCGTPNGAKCKKSCNACGGGGALMADVTDAEIEAWSE